MNTPRNAAAPRSLGLLGGTFDPVHRAHLETADAVRRHFALDEVLVIPSARPPHKSRRALTAAEHRLAMVRLAVADRPGLTASDVELQRDGPSYTIDTVVAIKDRYTTASRLFFILGADAFLEFDTWKSYTHLLNEIPLVVLARGGTPADLPRLQAELAAYIRRHIDGGYRWDDAATAFVHPDRQSIHLFDGPRLSIAATDIRRRIRAGERWQDLLPTAVAAYIQHKGLYR